MSNKSNKDRGMGWRADPVDDRDFKFSLVAAAEEKPKPTSFILPSVTVYYDQKSTNSCVANGVASDVGFLIRKQHSGHVFGPSRLFIYYNARDAINEAHMDEGCVIRDAFKSVNKQGVCPESLWAFSQKVTSKPTTECYDEALKCLGIRYERLDRNIDLMKDCLYAGFPFVMGFRVPQSFKSTATRSTGVVQIPKQGENLVGGHAVMIIGWDDEKKHLVFRNSYGKKWGDGGNGYLPYAFVENEKWSSDFWMFRLIQLEGFDAPTPVPAPEPAPAPAPEEIKCYKVS